MGKTIPGRVGDGNLGEEDGGDGRPNARSWLAGATGRAAIVPRLTSGREVGAYQRNKHCDWAGRLQGTQESNGQFTWPRVVSLARKHRW